jgi:hypothetical protein
MNALTEVVVAVAQSDRAASAQDALLHCSGFLAPAIRTRPRHRIRQFARIASPMPRPPPVITAAPPSDSVSFAW